ncbi:hypothetical protein [Paraburkholderia fungorum]|uniref:hypothetical protein n=1 Tax=Paraburkholderia fungorum TaxID=134537 RepID=UPI0038BC5D62
MRSLAQAWPDVEFVQQPAAQLPWSHLYVPCWTRAGIQSNEAGMSARPLSTVGRGK